MDQKTILIINNGTSGLYGFRRELLEALCKEYRVVALAKRTGNTPDLIAMGVEVIPVEMDYHGKNPLKELKLVSFYQNQLREIKPDVVLTYTIKPNIYGGMACAKLGIPCIANVTGLGTAVEYRGMLQKLTVFLYRRGLRKAAKVFFQNTENRDFMLSRHMVTGAWDLLPGSGVNLERFTPMEYPKGDTVDFSYISRIMKEKGVDQYLEAAETVTTRHPEARFHIYGQCPDNYKERIEALQARGVICFHGYTNDVREVHRSSCCTVHPSYYPEGMSNVLLESAACARPVITTDRAGCRETLDDGVTGFMVRQRDSADLIEKLERFLALPWERRRAMGQAGRAKMEREFDRRIVVNKYLKEIEAILNGQQA